MPPSPVKDNVTCILNENSYSVSSAIKGNLNHHQKHKTTFSQIFCGLHHRFVTLAHKELLTGQSAIATGSRQLGRTRELREAFINCLPNKTKRFLLDQSNTMLVNELREKVARRETSLNNSILKMVTKQHLMKIHLKSTAEWAASITCLPARWLLKNKWKLFRND